MSLYPGGVEAISRGLSVAMPPDMVTPSSFAPQGGASGGANHSTDVAWKDRDEYVPRAANLLAPLRGAPERRRHVVRG